MACKVSSSAQQRQTFKGIVNAIDSAVISTLHGLDEKNQFFSSHLDSVVNNEYMYCLTALSDSAETAFALNFERENSRLIGVNQYNQSRGP
ncbi:MAG: hypothetical protein GY949_07665 [Gammaproteobacteria bacterium]|nr:hypothetical protein [Gammaproteobacteria bacterium]